MMNMEDIKVGVQYHWTKCYKEGSVKTYKVTVLDKLEDKLVCVVYFAYRFKKVLYLRPDNITKVGEIACFVSSQESRGRERLSTQ